MGTWPGGESHVSTGDSSRGKGSRRGLTQSMRREQCCPVAWQVCHAESTLLSAGPGSVTRCTFPMRKLTLFADSQ